MSAGGKSLAVRCQLKDSECVESRLGGTLNSQCHKQVQPPPTPRSLARMWWDDDDIPFMKRNGSQAGLCEDMQAQSLNETSTSSFFIPVMLPDNTTKNNTVFEWLKILAELLVKQIYNFGRFVQTIIGEFSYIVA